MAEIEPNEPNRTPPDDRHVKKKRKKVTWKSVLGVAVALFIVWQVGHAFIQGQGKHAGRVPAPPSTSAPAPKPTPTPTVTLGGRRIAAGSGPVIALDPGLVSPGGHVGVVGSGFDRKMAVVVSLQTSRARAAKVVTHGHTSVSGTLTAGFTMPMSFTGSKASVVVREANGVQTSAQLVTPGGMGTASITGKAAGKPGDHVTVSAKGFGPGEKVNVFWGRINGTPAATLTADSGGSISSASVPVGIAPVGPTTLVLVGMKTHTTATVPYQMLGLYPTTISRPYAVKAGKSISFRGNGFAPSEPVLIYLDASGGIPALTAKTDSSGGFSVNFVVPFGLKGSQRLIAVGEQSRASVSSGFDILPYIPSAQASTYGALPGTTISFYGKGFAPNEVVLVYLGGGRGHGGQLVTAFRVDSHGSASAAGSYVVPSGVGPSVGFSLVGQQSGGAARAKLSVGAAAQSVTVPPQPPYVLPPSLGGKPPATHSPASGSPSTSPSGSASQPASSHP
jgi:hypothetical protein